MKRGELVKNQFIDEQDVRNLCIENNFYTRGDCEAYANMFEMCKQSPTNEALADIAKDIWQHSSGEALADLDSYLSIMNMLYNRCVFTYFSEVK